MGSETDCEDCTCLVGRSESQSPTPYKVFHEPCNNCQAPTDDLRLCRWCRHLRLKHLMFCDSAPSWAEISLGSFDDIQRSKDCGFHNLICQSVGAYVDVIKPKTVPLSSLHFSLETSRHPEAGGDHAQMQIGISGDDYSTGFDAFRVYLEDFERVQTILARAPVLEQIDWDRANGWLARCTHEHEECQPVVDRALPYDFRVIDVVERRVVKPSPDCEFVALSYVWGNNPDPTKTMATLSTIKDLEKIGGLQASKLPLLIEDAMQACMLLKQRYLWADRLCIVQDDFANKNEHIDGMVAIYASAAFALVIAHGDSTDVQIPGVSLPRPMRTSHLQFGGLLVMNNLPSFKATIESTPWFTRGWTYQESVLPSRKVFLTGAQIMFECRQGLLHEDNALNEDPEYEIDLPVRFQGLSFKLFSRTEDYDVMFDYAKHVSAYNARSLTYITDVYNALTGITDVLYGPMGSLLHGLPLKDFDHALLWHPDAAFEYEPRPSLDIWLPSWSWSSVSGRLSYPSFYGSLLQWAVITGTAPRQHTKLIGIDRNIPSKWAEWRLLTPNKDSGRLEVPQIYMALAWAERCTETEPGFSLELLSKKGFKELGTELMAQWPSYTDFCRDVLSTETLLKDIQTALPKDDISARKECTIATHAQVAYLGLGIHQHGSTWHCSNAGSWYDILDNDQSIGLLGPSIDLEELNLREGLHTSLFKFIGLSISGCDLYVKCIDHDREYPPIEKTHHVGDEYIEDKELDITYWDCNDVPLKPAPVVNVMVIGERNGSSCRWAVGWIFLKKWAKLRRHSETIFLT